MPVSLNDLVGPREIVLFTSRNLVEIVARSKRPGLE
jgi:hypothetical protein